MMLRILPHRLHHQQQPPRQLAPVDPAL
jgi:hypothetical protein